eukprot:2900870-Pleurochrysis_carterae.AAC.3
MPSFAVTRAREGKTRASELCAHAQSHLGPQLKALAQHYNTSSRRARPITRREREWGRAWAAQVRVRRAWRRRRAARPPPRRARPGRAAAGRGSRRRASSACVAATPSANATSRQPGPSTSPPNQPPPWGSQCPYDRRPKLLLTPTLALALASKLASASALASA